MNTAVQSVSACNSDLFRRYSEIVAITRGFTIFRDANIIENITLQKQGEKVEKSNELNYF